jgi:plastocyanin
MRKLGIVLAAGAVGLVGSLGMTQAQLMFDPAVHHLEDMEPLILGSEDNSFHMEPKEYRLTVGQGYRWKIKAETDFEYGVIAPEFFRNIYIRKIEAEEIEISTPTLEKISFEDVGEAELTFVAIRPGTYEFGVQNMKQRGMVGKIIVEASGDN